MKVRTNKMSGLLLLALAGLTACNGETDLLDVAPQTRAMVEQRVATVSQNPVYVLGEKDGNGVYTATPVSATETEGLTVLDVTVSLPQAATLTGISFTAPADKTIAGGDHMVFAEFRNAAGENYVALAAGHRIRFTLPIAPVALAAGELAVRLHTTGGVLYETKVDCAITPGCTVTLALDGFAAMSKQWLSLLDDDTPLSALSLPGTHDAATGEGTTMSVGVTQSLTLQQQWDAGVRVFDLRPGYKKVRKSLFKYVNELHIYHGIVETKISFANAIKCLTNNLQAHPEEFAVVVMRFENDSPLYKDRSVWNSLMSTYLANELPAAYKVDYHPGLTLGDVRGKLLILSRDAYADRPVTGGFISGWSHSDAGTTSGVITSATGMTAPLNVQDWYSVSDVNTKCNALCNFVRLSSAAETGRLTINHASGYTGSGTNSGILNNAAATQPALFRYLTADDRNEGCAGIIMMDHAGVRSKKSGTKTYQVYGDLAMQAVIDNNFKY